MRESRLESGDLLLFMGTDRAIEGLRRSEDVILLDHPPTPSRSMRRKTPWVVATVAAVILVSALNILPIAASALVGVALVMAFGVLTPKEGYDSIEWSIMMLIFGMLGLGLAMQTTGAAELMARGLVSLASIDVVPAAWAPWVVLAALWLVTTVMTETLSNNATVVLMAPVALSLGAQLQVDPRPFVIATCIAASASFATPIGYQTNTFVYGAGGYRFTDFLRVGVPLNILFALLSVIVLPYFFPF
jgi:di/tricarboxylate transporter